LHSTPPARHPAALAFTGKWHSVQLQQIRASATGARTHQGAQRGSRSGNKDAGAGHQNGWAGFVVDEKIFGKILPIPNFQPDLFQRGSKLAGKEHRGRDESWSNDGWFLSYIIVHDSVRDWGEVLGDIQLEEKVERQATGTGRPYLRRMVVVS
jgi:hypothetical protein